MTFNTLIVNNIHTKVKMKPIINRVNSFENIFFSQSDLDSTEKLIVRCQLN